MMLEATVNPLVMQIQLIPKYFSLMSQITAVKNSGFFKHFQQRYEGNRVNVIFSDYEAYRYPISP